MGVILKPITDFSPTVGKSSDAIAQDLPMSIVKSFGGELDSA
ncbi:MAG: hypothetical protein V7L25_32265 [Nostoc sp.]